MLRNFVCSIPRCLSSIIIPFFLTLFTLLPSPILAQAWQASETSTQTFAGEMTVCNYSQFGTDQGLTSNSVNVVFRDNDGLLWVGTEDGLNSYDGYSLNRYLPNNSDSTFISGKQVFEISQFAQDLIMLSLGDGGLNLYDKKHRTFQQIDLGDFFSDRTVSNSCFGLCRVSSEICAVFPEGVIKRDLITGRTKLIDMPKKMTKTGVKWGRIKMSIMPGESGMVAMMTGTKSVSILDVKYETVKETSFPYMYIYDICPLDADRLLLATQDGIFSFNIHTGDYKQLDLLRNELVYAITRNTEGHYWIAYGGNKLLKWMPSFQQYMTVSNSYQLMHPRTRVNDLYEDDNGVLWVATNNNGVLKIDTKLPKIFTRRLDVDLPINYHNLDISAAIDGEVWIACGISGFVRVDMDKGQTEVIKVPHSNVSSIRARQNGIVLVGTTKGLWTYNTKSKALDELTISDQYVDSAGRVMVRSIDEDCLGNIWLATQLGLYRYNGVKFERAEVASEAAEVFNCIMEDSDGKLWAGSCSGSWVKDVNSNSFRRIGKVWKGKNEDGILCIAECADKIFMGTTEGLMVYDRQTALEINDPVKESFSNKMIYSLISDNNGILWVSTSSGIAYVDINYGSVFSFGKSDGLYYEGNECRKFAMCNDHIYFGQAAAINFIDTRSIVFNTRMPKTYVSSITYGQSGAEEQMPMRNDSTYEAKFSVNSAMRINVASSDYTATERNQFMYKLDNNEWVNLRHNHEILFSGMLPGTYKLSLRSANSDMTWSYDIKTIYLQLNSPLWASMPAIICYGIIIMTVLWLILNMRFRSINRRMKMAEAEVRSKKIVEEQRNKLAHAINEQKASFGYAKRIQDALMPKVEVAQEHMAKFFVLYRPKEIVSGDFYTFYYRDGKTFVISADCTGHGVPGAFISILGIDHLDNIVMQQKVDDAGEILTRLHAELHESVKKIGSEEFNDGMDITICVVDHDNMTMNFAGAMNDLFLIRNNEVLVYPGQRNSIGANMSFDTQVKTVVFKSQDIKCQPGDMMYLFSDGYMDQFGGPEQKKFKVRRFKNLLLNVHKLPAADQRILLNQKLEDWMGPLEQTDDISIIGFEPWA